MGNDKRWSRLLRPVMSVFLAVILSLSPVLVFAAGDEQDGEINASLSTVLGDSIEEELTVVEVETEADLRALAARVNGGDSMQKHIVKLKNNINIDENVSWVPIGSDAAMPFSGVFDGQGFTISGIRVEGGVYGGLFGFLLDAQVKNLTINDFVAQNSTGGMFYSAIRSTVDMSRSENPLARSLFGSTFSNPTASWVGPGPDTSWYNPLLPPVPGDVITLDSCEKLAGLADVVLNEGDPLTGVTFMLDRSLDMTGAGTNMVPIGDMNAMEFSGKLVGNGFSVIGLEDALFGYTIEATIMGVTIEGSNINTTVSGQDHGAYGALIHLAEDTNVSQIHIKSCEIIGNDTQTYWGSRSGTGGAIGGISTSGVGTSIISKVFVENTTIVGDSYVGGVVGNANVTSLTECAVYGGSIENQCPSAWLGTDGFTGGIAGMFLPIGSAGSVKDCLVVGTDLGNNEYVAGLAWIANFRGAFSNGVVSDIGIGVASTANPNTYLAVGRGASIGGAMNILTDSQLEYRLVPDPATTALTDGVTNVFWDNHTSHQNNPISGTNFNQAMSTAALTDGEWAPDVNSWKTTENFYPQIGTLANRSWNSSVPIVSALAATTPVPSSVDENYLSGAGYLLLPNRIEIDGSGTVDVNWSGYSHSGILEIPTGNGVILSSKGGTVGGLNLTAEINGYTKSFKNVTIADTKLEFSHTIPAQNDTVEADGTSVYTVVFQEPIAENPLAAAKYFELREIRASGEAVVETIPLDTTATAKYTIENKADGKGYANFKLDKLQPGKKYKVVVPAEAFTENANDKALSAEVVGEFATFDAGKPTIAFKKELSFSIGHDLTESELVTNVVVKDFDGAVMYDGASASAITPQKYTGSNWNANDVDNSQRAILSEIGNSEIHYIVVDGSVFDSATREGGLYEMYVFAKNAKGRGSVRLMTFSISGFPEWVVEPKPVVHIQWTTNKQAVIDAAVQKARAEIKQKNKDAIPCVVTAEIDDAEWALVDSFTKGPDAVRATVVAKDPSGVNDLKVEIDVYLDRPLYWTTTPSPVTMYISTKSLVEKKIDFVAGNFNSKIVEYDHFENNYRKPGKYYVDIFSTEQHTTDCNLEKCPYDDHPSKKVDDTFIVEIIDTPGYAVPSYWGAAAASILSYNQENADFESAYVYSRNIINMQPNNFHMPSFIPEALRHQEYGRAELNYGKYRWNIYSNTLDTSYSWSDLYNLEVEMNSISSGIDDSIQLKFGHTGRLFGAVEFDVNLDEARLLAAKLPKDNLGLYRYDGVSGKLVLVSNVIVEDGKWASALINEIYPTTYVLKGRQDKEAVVASKPQNLNDFISATKVFENGIVKDGDAKFVTLPNNDEDYKKLYKQEPEMVEPKKNPSWVKVAAAIVAVAGIGTVAAVLYSRKRKEEK